MQGTFYGVGVGPGDPGLLTLKAIRTIEKCQVLAIAVSSPDLKNPVYEEAEPTEEALSYLQKCVAYNIVIQEVPKVRKKPKLYLPMPMMKEKGRLKEIHDRCADTAEELLNQGKSIAFITLGDPSIYSTCLYVQKRLKRRNVRTELIPGIPSFCAAACELNMGLVENKEELHVIPASYGVEESLRLSGTKVLMKAGRKMPAVKRAVREAGLHMDMVENCGMPDQHVYRSEEEIPDDAGYYSLIMIKE